MGNDEGKAKGFKVGKISLTSQTMLVNQIVSFD
jgi:hypothetical protein